MDISYIDKMNRLGKKWDVAARAVIQVHRIIANMSQADVAKKLNATKKIVADFESGRSTVYFADVFMFAKAFEIPPGALFRRIMLWIDAT